MKFTVELPPTLNETYKVSGSVIYMSPTAKAWKQKTAWIVKTCWRKKPSVHPIDIRIQMYYKFDRDWDSSVKLLCDAMAGIVYKNDKQIFWASVYKQKDAEWPRLEVDVREEDKK